jgi:hypothetical protein
VTVVRAEGPVPVPPEVVDHGHDERHRRRDEVVHAGQFVRDREGGEVDDVAAAADGHELHELDPVVLAPHPVPHAHVHGRRCRRRRLHERLFRHRHESTAK